MGLNASNRQVSFANFLNEPQGILGGTGLATAFNSPPLMSARGLGILGQAMAPPTQAPLLGGLNLVSLANDAPKWIYVTERFKIFLSNLELTSAQHQDGLTKACGVISCLNAAYYGHSSNTENAFFIGSWAKKTRIRPPRDVDIYFLLPLAVYNRFEAYSGNANKQSALLQEVKSKLLLSYTTSTIKGDGPVVLADFNSYTVEVVPAFLYDQNELSYYVSNTKDGGSYKKTMPFHEIDAITAADSRNANNVRRLIHMLKAWQAYCSVQIKSFYLELLAIEFTDQWAFNQCDYFYYDWITRDFFKWVVTKANAFLWAPGTNEKLWLGDAWKSRADSAYLRALKACDYERANDMGNAGDEWQKIFGPNIPKWI